MQLKINDMLTSWDQNCLMRRRVLFRSGMHNRKLLKNNKNHSFSSDRKKQITTGVILLTQGAGHAGRIQTFASKRLWKVNKQTQYFLKNSLQLNDCIQKLCCTLFSSIQCQINLLLIKGPHKPDSENLWEAN